MQSNEKLHVKKNQYDGAVSIQNEEYAGREKTRMKRHQLSYGSQLISIILNSIKTANNQR